MMHSNFKTLSLSVSLDSDFWKVWNIYVSDVEEAWLVYALGIASRTRNLWTWQVFLVMLYQTREQGGTIESLWLEWVMTVLASDKDDDADAERDHMSNDESDMDEAWGDLKTLTRNKN